MLRSQVSATTRQPPKPLRFWSFAAYFPCDTTEGLACVGCLAHSAMTPTHHIRRDIARATRRPAADAKSGATERRFIHVSCGFLDVLQGPQLLSKLLVGAMSGTREINGSALSAQSCC